MGETEVYTDRDCTAPPVLCSGVYYCDINYFLKYILLRNILK